MEGIKLGWLLVSCIVVLAIYGAIGGALAVPEAGLALGLVMIIVILVNVKVKARNGSSKTIFLNNSLPGWMETVMILVSFVALLALLLAFITSVDFMKEMRTSKEYWVQKKTNDLRKQNMQSEVESGIFGTLSADAAIYDRFGNVHTHKGKAIVLPCGTLVMALDLDGIPANDVHEGFTRVITTNKHGDFVRSSENVFYVVSNKIDWVKKIKRR